MTIPKIAIPYGANPVVYIDGQKAQDQGYSQNDNNYYVWYTTKFSTHQMAIQFALSPLPQGVSSELVIFAIIPVAAIILVITVLAIKRSRRKTDRPELEIKDSTSKSITTRISNNTISANNIPKVQSAPPLNNEIKGSNSSPESNQNLTSQQKADNLKQKEDKAKCSYHFGYLRNHPKGKKTPEECYFCNRLIECHGETPVLS